MGEMNPPPPPPPPTPKKEVQLQGPRPSPLKVNKESVKIKKPPPHPHPHQHVPHQRQHEQQQQQQPVVIYTVSPKVIHATVSEFMSLVQRLTGPSSSPSSSSADGGLSPAARLASIHKTSPKYSSTTSNNNTITSHDDQDLMETIINNLEDQGRGREYEMGQFPGILSPGPATLPPIPSGFFSPALSHQLDVLNWGHGIGNNNYNNNSFNFTASPSPSALISAPLVSPSPSSWDLFNNFLDFL